MKLSDNEKKAKRNELGCLILKFKDDLLSIKSKLENIVDPTDKAELEHDVLSKLKKYGLPDEIESIDLVLATLDAVGKDSEVKTSIPTIEEININENISLDNLIERKGLDWYNVHSCIDTIAGNKIPVLVGLAGAGKTYTLDNMCEIIHRYKEDCGSKFDKMFKVKIPCSNISHNDFWGSFDAVSHVCVGKFKYIWQLAKENADTLYYVILDELLDMYDIRKTFGDSFSVLTSLPNNLVVVGTGNKDVFDVSNETARNMMRDSGILGRFNLIEVSNILQDVDSESFNYFFNDVVKAETPLEEHIKNFVIKIASASNYKDKMLVPRNVIDFIKRGSQYTSEDEFMKLMKYYIKQDSNYIKKLLFVDKPVEEKDKDDAVDLFEGLWNA